MAFADALREHGAGRALSRDEDRVLMLVDFARDFGAGGYAQWLRNAGREGALETVAALRAIDCPKAANLTQEAIDVVGADRLRDPVSLEPRLADLSVRRHLQECDAIQAGNDEMLAEKLLQWIAEQPGRIAL